jgi:hypothetical protein
MGPCKDFELESQLLDAALEREDRSTHKISCRDSTPGGSLE